MFISFEGGEGTGKSTQASLLVQRLADAGYRPVLVREPGGTPLGEYLREWLKAKTPLTPQAELYLFAAARAELVSREILPALDEGKVVVADRFADSTVAYQGYGRGLGREHIRAINLSATQARMPDVTFLLALPPEEALGRVTFPPRQSGPSGPERPATRRESEGRRFEDEALDFHRRVYLGYMEMAAAEPKRWVVLDGHHKSLDLAERVWAEVSSRLRARHVQP